MYNPTSETSIGDLQYATAISETKGALVKMLYCNVNGGRFKFQATESRVDPLDPQTRDMLPSSPFAISEPMAGSNPNNLKLVTSVTNPAMRAWLQALDERNKQVVMDMVREDPKLFPKQTPEQIAEVYTPCLKLPSSDKYPPTVTFKVKVGDERDPTNIMLHDSSKGLGGKTSIASKKGSSDDLVPGARFLILAEAVGLWFQTRQDRLHGFGMSLNASQILVYPAAAPAHVLEMFAWSQNVVPADHVVPADDVVAADDMVAADRNDKKREREVEPASADDAKKPKEEDHGATGESSPEPK